jgi:hypothetical protein
MDRYVAAFALAISIGLAGCNQPSQTADNTTKPNPETQGSQATNPTQPKSNLGATPETAVSEFLEALRAGNEETAAALLSSLARQETAKIGLTVSPPGSPTAKYTVGKPEMKTDETGKEYVGAHVLSRWTNTDEDGKTRTDDIYWVLRKEPEGWRIVGSVMKVYADKEPLVLNYEDPADMQRKLQMVHETDAQMENQQSQAPNGQPQATLPQGNPATIR